MPRAVGDAVTAAAIPGVVVVAEPRRCTRRALCSGPVLGFAGVATPEDEKRWPGLPPGEIVGRAGLEQEYDAVLRGVDGRQCLYVDPRGVPVALGQLQPPVPGANLRLSLDLGLQRQLDASVAASLAAQHRPAGKVGRRRGDGSAVGAAPRHRERSVVGRQRLRTAGRRRGAEGPGRGARVRRCSIT